jgi:hypothetical protein
VGRVTLGGAKSFSQARPWLPWALYAIAGLVGCLPLIQPDWILEPRNFDASSSAYQWLGLAVVVFAVVALLYETYIYQLRIYLKECGDKAASPEGESGSTQSSATPPDNTLRAAFSVPGGPFTILGLLGTFGGLVVSLHTSDFAAAMSLETDAQDRADLWGQLASGASLALLTSIIGIILFVYFKIRHQALIQEALPRVDQNLETHNYLRKNSEETHGDLKKTSEGVQVLIEKLNEVMDLMTKTDGRMNTACEYLVETCDKLKFQDSVESLKTQIYSLQNQLDSFNVGAEKTDKLVNRVNNQITKFSKMEVELKEAGEYFKAQVKSADEVLRGSRGELSALSSSVSKTKEAVDGIVRAAGSKREFQKLSASLMAIASAIDEAMDDRGSSNGLGPGGRP